MNGQLGQSRRRAGEDGSIELTDLGYEDGRRPRVGHDVVHRDDGHVSLCVQADDLGPQERGPRPVEVARPLAFDQVLERLPRIRERRAFPVDEVELQRGPGQDALSRLLRLEDDGRTQHFMPVDHPLEGVAQHAHLEWSGEPERVDDVVGRRSGRELLDEP